MDLWSILLDKITHLGESNGVFHGEFRGEVNFRILFNGLLQLLTLI